MMPIFNLVVTTAKHPLKPKCIFKKKMPYIAGVLSSIGRKIKPQTCDAIDYLIIDLRSVEISLVTESL